jgi:hypothetical protein
VPRWQNLYKPDDLCKDGEEMKVLIATLGIGKGTWGHVGRLMQEEWDKVILMSNEWTKERFSHEKEVEWILVNSRSSIDTMVDEIKDNLDKLENVHINLTSGSGKEHMALLFALKSKNIPYGLCYLTRDGIKTE